MGRLIERFELFAHSLALALNNGGGERAADCSLRWLVCPLQLQTPNTRSVPHVGHVVRLANMRTEMSPPPKPIKNNCFDSEMWNLANDPKKLLIDPFCTYERPNFRMLNGIPLLYIRVNTPLFNQTLITFALVVHIQ